MTPAVTISFFFILVVGCYSENLYAEPEVDFDIWGRQHGKSYESTVEYYKRRDIFRSNVQRVNRHNSQDGNSYNLGVNKFADLTFEEFSQQHLLNSPQNCSATHGEKRRVRKGLTLPTSVDWRVKGVVSPVKNQGQCGSCWTFSTTGAMESHTAIKTGAKFVLSEQQLVDCAQAFNNQGCDGGLPSQAFEYIRYAPGLMQEEDYPYTAKDGQCHFQADKAVTWVNNVVNITAADENGLQAAVAAVGPVSIAFDVASDFQLYKSGVYNSKECSSDPGHVNHAVLAVGYDVSSTGEPYWIVKNSWGTDFGLSGYFWIHRGSNMCGLSDCASYPIIGKNPGRNRIRAQIPSM